MLLVDTSGSMDPAQREAQADFLEALLAARERLVISYPGLDLHRNSRQPPSVVVGELLDQGRAMPDHADRGADGPDRRIAEVLRASGLDQQREALLLQPPVLAALSAQRGRAGRDAAG